VIDAIHKLMERETAGDPISGLKWTRKTTDKIARQLKRLGIAVSRNTVGRLLRQMKYSLRTNRKKISTGSTSDRDRQFRYLCRQRDQFEKRGDPVLSVDAKKRELIGNFKNPGVKWEQSCTDVSDHDFGSDATGIGIPYGIYDTQANRGSVLPRNFPRNIRLRRLLPQQVVANGRTQTLPAIQPHPYPGRYRRQQWGPTWRLEARDSAATVRSPGTQHHRFSLPFRRLQMESHRASFVQSDQQELGSRAAGQL
jgi:hypothetical protein